MENKEEQQLKSSIETDIKLIGDKGTISQIVILLAYIRHYLQTGESGDINVSVGKNMKTDFFAMQVNEQEIQDIYPLKEVEIN